MLESLVPLCSGAFAGLAVDLSLFPIDTLKTRLQAQGGFKANGGYRGLYKGMGSIAAGSAPGAALFFLSYETARNSVPITDHTLLAIVSSCIAETLACLIRTPTEVVKQRTQVSRSSSSLQTLRVVLQADGVRGLYRGFAGTMIRELPFVAIQFPLWEKLKEMAVRERGSTRHLQAVPRHELPEATAAEAALCGAAAGSIAAACTTPLDVMKTRLMLASNKQGWWQTARKIAHEEGIAAFMRGVVPRVGWISVGGFIFLGGYSAASQALGTFVEVL